MKNLVLFVLLSVFPIVFLSAQNEVYHLKSITLIESKEDKKFQEFKGYYQVEVDLKAKTISIPLLSNEWTFKIKNRKFLVGNENGKVYSGTLTDAQNNTYSLFQTVNRASNYVKFDISAPSFHLIFDCYAVPYFSPDRYEDSKDKVINYFIRPFKFLGKTVYQDNLTLDLIKSKLFIPGNQEFNFTIKGRKEISDNIHETIYSIQMQGRSGIFMAKQIFDKNTGGTIFKLTNAKNQTATIHAYIKNTTNAITDTTATNIIVEENPVELTKAKWLGSGFLIDENGFIATNYHIISNAARIEVGFQENNSIKYYDAELKLTNAENDVAILQVHHKDLLKKTAIPYGFSKDVQTGEHVFTIGYPLTDLLGASYKVSDGIINSTAGILSDNRYLQISTPLQQGNSGGPLFNEEGNVIGLTTSRLSSKLGMEVENINYAIKTYYLEQLYKQLNPSKHLLPKKVDANIPLKEKVMLFKDFVCIIKASN